MKNVTKHLLTGIVALASFSASANHLSDNLHFTARMNAEQETHAVTSDGEGVASFYLNDDMDSLCIDISMYNLSGPVTAIHIHEAEAGADGGVLVNLSDYLTAGNRVRIALTNSLLPTDLVAKMMMGRTYINAHTADNPAGEIRGQIGLETDWLIRSSLTTDAETHTVDPMGRMPSGMTTMVLGKNMATIKYRVVLNDLTGAITGAHLHEAATGMDGGVIVDLSSNIMGNTIMGEIDLASNADLVSKIMAGNVYINVHTAANAAGEVRGQLMVDQNLTFDSWLSTDQENHTVTGAPNAKGLAWLSINATMDSLWYDVLLDSLTGAVAASHIHNGAAGVDGGVAVALNAANGNWISGVITGNDLTADLVRSLLRGENYINVHTAANAAGEVRGQIYKHARSGYTVLLNAEQETHNVDNALAHGSGIVTVDRDRTNVHYMIVVNGLSGPVTGAHFHNAAMDMDGGVIYDLSGSFSKSGNSDGAFGYWTGTFNATEDAKILAGEVYVNVHTTANAAGEVRGQVLMGGECATVRVSVENISPSFTDVNAYPNPTSGVYSIDFVSEEMATGVIEVRDISGKVVLTKDVPVNNGNNHINIALGGLENGVYTVNIIVGKASAFNIKVVKL